METKKNSILPVSIVVGNLIRISNIGEDLTPNAPNATRWGMKLSYAKTKISNIVKRYRLLIKRRINCLCQDQLFVPTCFSGMESSESWLIDSGCTNHMTHDKDLFKKLRSTNMLKVRIGNRQYIIVEENGTVAISSCSGIKLISDVLYVPEINQNLLSVGQLIEKDYKVVFEDKSCLIKDAVSQDIFRVKMRRKSFALNPLKREQIAFPIKENIIEVWHKRLGHYHHQGMLQVKSKIMANDLLDLDDHIPNRKACQFGKQNRKPFPKVTWRASKKLQLIHSDIAGPQRTYL